MNGQHMGEQALPPSIIFWGGTNQSKVLRPLARHYGMSLACIFDDKVTVQSPFPDVELLHGWESFLRWIKGRDPSKIGFSVAIGNQHGLIRLSLHERLSAAGLKPVKLIHPSAVIADDAEIGDGCQILAGVVVGVLTRVGKQCLVNTNASIDHENTLEDGATVSPGATLCGSVYLEKAAWICSGATILPGIRIGASATVGGGALVRRDVPAGMTVVGVPARPIVRRKEALHG